MTHHEYSDSSYNRTITAFFDSREDASEAVERLVSNGISRDRINLVAGSSSSQTASSSASSSSSSNQGGFWDSLKDLFMPDEDRYSYAEGLSRGGYLVTVRASDSEYDTALDILDDEGTVNMGEREESWRSEGWRGYEGRSDVDSTGFWRNEQSVAGSAAGMASGQNMQGSISSGQRVPDTGLMSGQQQQRTFSDDEVIPVAEEELRIGKRDVTHGRVRVRSYVVEEPVTEQVNLREERVSIERRPVSGTTTAGDANLFQDRTIAVEEHGEEAVVAKDVRVKEEIALRKDVEERTETVSDTVRHTEVEIEDDRTDDDLNRRTGFSSDRTNR
jgi:uncharacterized protein (TIGR02271 family)